MTNGVVVWCGLVVAIQWIASAHQDNLNNPQKEGRAWMSVGKVTTGCVSPVWCYCADCLSPTVSMPLHCLTTPLLCHTHPLQGCGSGKRRTDSTAGVARLRRASPAGACASCRSVKPATGRARRAATAAHRHRGVYGQVCNFCCVLSMLSIDTVQCGLIFESARVQCTVWSVRSAANN